MDKSKDNKDAISPSVSKKKNVTVRRTKSEVKPKTRTVLQTSNEPNRNIFTAIGNWRRNGRTSQKKESAFSEPGTPVIQKTLYDSIMSHPSTNETQDIDQLTEFETLTGPNADEYFMKHKRRGMAIILNHENFEKEEARKGSKLDVEKLNETLNVLKFKVETHTDLEYSDILDLIKKLSKQDYTDCDCFVLFVMTHGNERGEITAKDVYYPVEKIWHPFAGSSCTSLAGKPKLFFFNACRGIKKDSGIKLFNRGRTQVDSSKKKHGFKIPNHADFLLAFSTVDGFYSYREVESGSWFIQILCETILNHYKTKDLLKILTLTARQMALNYRTVADKEEDNELTQVPQITTMLLRDLYFRD